MEAVSRLLSHVPAQQHEFDAVFHNGIDNSVSDVESDHSPLGVTSPNGYEIQRGYEITQVRRDRLKEVVHVKIGGDYHFTEYYTADGEEVGSSSVFLSTWIGEGYQVRAVRFRDGKPLPPRKDGSEYEYLPTLEEAIKYAKADFKKARARAKRWSKRQTAKS